MVPYRGDRTESDNCPDRYFKALSIFENYSKLLDELADNV